MKRLLLALAGSLLLGSSALAQVYQGPAVMTYPNGANTPEDCVEIGSQGGGYLVDSGAKCGGGSAPGSSGQIIYNSGGTLAGFTPGGDVTFSAPNFTVDSIGGKAVALGAAFTTTGTGAPTLVFPSAPYAYTFPSANSTLAMVGGNLGVFTGASLALGGATLGTNALAVTGSSTFSATLTVPSGAYNSKNIVFGTSGAELDANASDFQFNFSGAVNSAVTLNGIEESGYYGFGVIGSNSTAFLTSYGTADIQFGAADAAAPVAQTIGPQNVVAGTSNTAGQNFTITGSRGTGTGAGGSIIFQTAPAGSTGTSQNAEATALKIDSAGQFTLGVAPTTDTPSSGSVYLCYNPTSGKIQVANTGTCS